MGEQRVTVERRQLGAELRRLREGAGRHQKDIAAILDCASSLISRVEHGDRLLKTIEVQAVLDFLGVTGAEREAVLDLTRRARTRQPRRMFSDPLPVAFRRLADLEEMATEISYFTGELVPGMLQTEGYAGWLIKSAISVMEVRTEEIEARLRFRLERQMLLDKQPPPRMWFVIGETALRRPVGGPDVMRDQLLRLLEVIDEYPHVTVQAVPVAVVDHPLLDGSLTLFRFDGQGSDIVHQSIAVGGGIYSDDERSVTECSRAYDRLRAVALGPAQSRDFIARCAKEL